MLIPSACREAIAQNPSLSRRVNANSQQQQHERIIGAKLIKKGEC